MPVSTLDPTTALIVIDLQAGIVGYPTIHPAADVVRRSRELADAFRAHGLPVVLVNVAGQPPGRTEAPRRDVSALPPEWTAFVDELDRRPDDIVVTKHTRGAFTHTGLEEELRRRGVSQVVLTGIATGAGVESTARDAHERGFHVTLATDAMTDVDAERHRHAIEAVFPVIGERGTTEEILALLQRTRA